MFPWGLSVLKSHGGVQLKFVGEAFNVVGYVGEGENCGGAWKIMGELKKSMAESFRGGLLWRGVSLN